MSTSSSAGVDSVSGRPDKVRPLDWPVRSELVGPVLLEIEHQVKLRKRRRARKGGAVAVLAAALGLVWAVPFYRDTGTLETVAANRQTITLVDGSRAEMNARTLLHTDFRYGRRTVRMTQGEAFFVVARDAEHPFLVETPAGTVRVTGTQFNVRLAKDAPPEVTLLEGSVEIKTLGAGAGVPVNMALAPGEQFSRGVVRALSGAELEHVTAWREGRLVLAGLTLAEACARYSAYHGREIAVPPQFAGVRLGGSCPLDDLKGFLAVIEESLPVSAVASGDGSYRLTAR